MRGLICVILLLVCAACAEEESGDGGPRATWIAIAASTSHQGRVGQFYEGSITTTGGLGGSYVWGFHGGQLPDGVGLTGDAAGARISGVPVLPGIFNVDLGVWGSNGDYALITLQIVIQPSPPVAIDPASLGPGVAGAPLNVFIGTTGGTGESYQWALVAGALPAGVVLVPGTPAARLQGIPTQAGTWTFTLEVQDWLGETAIRAMSLVILPPPLAIAPTVFPAGYDGLAYQHDVTAAGGTSTGYSWTVSAGALPPGLTIVQGTPVAALQGTPTQVGMFTFTLLVSDSAANVAARPFSLNVVPPVPLVITTPALANALEVQPYHEALSAIGGALPYAWSVVAGTLPPGLTINGDQLVGMATRPGTFAFTLQVADAGSFTAQQPYSITIDVAPHYFITPHDLPHVAVGHAYTFKLESAGGARPYTALAVTAGAMPAGLSLQGDGWTGLNMGRLVGTPTEAGNFEFTLEFSDALNQRAARAFSLEVLGGGGPLRVGNQHFGPWRTTEFVPPTPLSAVGGSGVVANWRVIAGSLPPGVVLHQTVQGDWQLAGQPVTAGAFSFTLQVTDSAASTATRSFAIDVDFASDLPLFYGAPVRERVLFQVSPSYLYHDPGMAALRAELSATILSLPAHFEFDMLAFGDHLPAVVSYSAPLWGQLMPATTANKNAALAWIHGPALDQRILNGEAYAAFQFACSNYPPGLRTMVHVGWTADGYSGLTPQIVADLPVMWTAFTDCHLIVVCMSLSTNYRTRMKMWADAVNGGFIAP